jgi:hypothetical protein
MSGGLSPEKMNLSVFPVSSFAAGFRDVFCKKKIRPEETVNDYQ